MSDSIVYDPSESAYHFTTESPGAVSDLSQADQEAIESFKRQTSGHQSIYKHPERLASELLSMSPEARETLLNELSYRSEFTHIAELLSDPAGLEGIDLTPIKESMVSVIEQRSGGDAASREAFLDSFLASGVISERGLAARTEMINLAANRMEDSIGTSLTMDAMEKVLVNYDPSAEGSSEALLNLTDNQPQASQRLAEYLFNAGRDTATQFLADADASGRLDEFIQTLNGMDSFEIPGMTEEVQQSLLQAAMPFVDTQVEGAALNSALDAETLDRNAREVLDNTNPVPDYYRQDPAESRAQEIEFLRQIYPDASDETLSSMVDSRADWETQDRSLLTEQAAAAARTGDTETLAEMDGQVDSLLREAQAALDGGDAEKAEQLAQLAGEMRGSITAGIQNAIEQVAASNASEQEKEDRILDIVSTAITVGVVTSVATVTGGTAAPALVATKGIVQDVVKDVLKDQVKAFLKEPTQNAVDHLLGLASDAVAGQEVNGQTIPETFSWPPSEERYVPQGSLQDAYHQGLTNATNNDQVGRRQAEVTGQ